MTREEIQAELKRLEPWFHRIDLGDGLYTKTESVMGEPVDHPLGPWQTIQKLLPSDLTGKFGMVDVRAAEALKKPVSLDAVKADPRLAKMALVTNARLSVQPVSDREWDIIRAEGGL